MAIKFSQFVNNLSGFEIQDTEWKYSTAVPRYDLLSNKVRFVPTCLVFAGPVTNVKYIKMCGRVRKQVFAE